MNIVNKLTLRHLKENKSRTVITTIGIIISVAMITAVFVAMASFMQLDADVTYLTGGHKHAIFYIDENQYEKLKNDDRIETIGVTANFNDYSSYKLEQGATDRSKTGDFYQGDYTHLNQMITGDYDGILPKNDGEIAVEQEFIEKNKLGWKIGDTVTIPVGMRYYIDDDGSEMYISGVYFGDEEFELRGDEEYKITAILHKNPATVGFNIVQGIDLNQLTDQNNLRLGATIELKDVNYKSLNTLKDIVKEYNIEEYRFNNDYLETHLAIDENSTVVMSLLPIVIIILLIIIVASIVLIYNAFAMSISERVRYLGMLSSVGATRKQKKLSVYYEGFILGAVGIPVGILAGITGIGITLKALGSKIIETGMINGVSDKNMSMRVVLPIWAIIGIILFSILTIFISSFVPSHKASSVTPIDAIRQREEIKVKARSLRSPKIIRLIFGYEGELAYKNLKRNGRKGRVITASIALSVILFLSVNSFCALFSQTIDLEASVPYQIQLTADYKDKESVSKDLESIDGINDFYGITLSYYYVSKDDESEIGSKLYKVFADTKALNKSYSNLFDDMRIIYINELDQKDFDELCRKNNITIDERNDAITAVIMNNTDHKNNSNKVYNDSILGKTFTINNSEVFRLAGFVDYDKDNYACNLNPPSGISIYVSVDASYDWFIKNSENPDTAYMYQYGIVTDSHEQVMDGIYDLDGKYETLYAYDIVESLQMMNTLTFVLQVFVYGFIALISLITIANIINTISTGIQMRRKEFAMLKSVGTAPNGFNKMMVLESAFYAMKALVFALPISVVIGFAMTKALSSNAIPFTLNIPLYLCVIAVVFVIVGITMLYSMHRLKKDNIVETLKEEIN